MNYQTEEKRPLTRSGPLDGSPPSSPSRQEYIFRGFFIAGVSLLWLASLWNGMVVGLLMAAWKGHFEDGTPLRNDYTGFVGLDLPLAVLVAFFFPVTSGKDDGSTLMLFDLYLMLQLGYVWVYVEAMRPGKKPTLVKNPIWIAFIWQAIGGAVALPLYFIYHTQWTKEHRRTRVVDVDKARSLPFAFLIGGVIPMLYLMAPTWLGSAARSIHEQQSIIALFQPDPVYVSVLLTAGTAVSYYLNAGQTRPKTFGAEKAVSWVRGLYLVGAGLAAVGHFYVIARMALADDASGLGFGRMYSPFAAGGAADVKDTVFRAAWLFLQWDTMVITLSSAAWVYFLLNQTSGGQKFASIPMILVFCVLTVVIGPGAAVTLGLYLSEGTLPEST